METPDFERTRDILLGTGDSEVQRLVRVLDPVFRRGKFRPADDTPGRERDLIAAVNAVFPAPFARRFADCVALDGELAAALHAWSAAAEADRDERERWLRLRFRPALLQVEACWKQIVHFLPFILIAALRRLDDETLRRGALNELARALNNYNAFYLRHDTERQQEASQYHLLVALMKLFRLLSEKGDLAADFLFAPLMGKSPEGFGAVFPQRFDAAMLLLHQVRNRLTHGGLADRIPAAAIAPVGDMVKWCFLDVIAVLAPICRAFALCYVTHSHSGATDAEVDTLDFSGKSGPVEARYRLSKEPQLEEFAFLPYRIYLVAREKRMGAGTGEMLAPRDYLDLTPFLIADRLRSSAARPGLSPTDRQLLFALQQYLEPMRRLLFSELGGRGDRPRPADAEDVEADLLLRQMGEFKNRTNQLTAQVSLGDRRQLGIATVRAQLWRISRDHLTALMETDRYDENGTLHSGKASELRSAYNAEVFVAPKESAAVTAFLSSPQRALLLVGDSGSGKSNLLIHHYLARLQAGQLAAFLAGRRLDAPSFSETIAAKLVAQVAGGWTSLGDLDDFLEENGETLTLFVDAVNEYSGPQGARSLLESLIAAIGGEKRLRRCRVVASCRSETWLQHRAAVGNDRPLDRELFFTRDGDAIRMSRFETPAERGALYAAYQRHYGLLPRSFAQLSPTVRGLIAQPFMMAMVAEAYANPASAPGQEKRRVPPDLDYYTLFEKLTERKAGDAQVLVPVANVADRAAMPEAIQEFCEKLAEMILERLTASEAAAAGRDALPIDAVNKRPELERFVQNRHAISVLEAVLQVGLLERVGIPQRNRDGKLVTSGAFAFFHDQYTQYWLAAAYQQRFLGWLNAERLGNAAKLDELVGRLAGIVARGVDAPILTGALDHWLQKNLQNFHDGRLDGAIPLLVRLAAHAQATLRHQAVALVTHLILRGVLTPANAYGPIFRTGSKPLRLELVAGFVDFWPSLPAAALQAFIDACDPEQDSEVLERLGDVFVLHLMLEPAPAVAYLEKAIKPLSVARIFEPLRIWRQSRFALQFAVFSVMTCFDRPDAVSAVRDFFRAKYRVVLDLLQDSDRQSTIGRVVRRPVRQLLFKVFDAFALAQWEKFIAGMSVSGNDRFFVENDGIVQHDVLAGFLPFTIDLHNGEFDRLSLAPGSPFRDLALRMLDFRPVSIIGYNALLCLPAILLRQNWSVTESLVMELIGRRTPSALYYGQLLLANLAYSDAKLAPAALALMRDRIIPELLRDGADSDWSIPFCIAMLDVERLWPIFDGLLDHFFAHFERLGDAAACAGFGDHLYKVCYCHDSKLGERVVARLLRERERFLGPLWRDATMKVLAAMLTRSPAILRACLAAQGLDESLMREARGFQSPEIVKQSRLFPLQVDINRFLAWIFVAEPRMRRAIVKHFIGSLALGSSIRDFPPGVRQTIVALFSVFFGDHPEDAPQGRLDRDEIAAAIAIARGKPRAEGRAR